MDTLQINIMDEIGGLGFTFQDMLAQAKGFKGKKIRVPVNSYGGSVLDALAIYNFLKGHSAEVETHIPAFAMSAGTIIAAAGDRVTMAENGFYMIHNPWSFAMGDAAELEHLADVLDKMKTEMVDIYHNKTKRKMGKKEIARMMDDETWMTAREALDMGFVDELTQGAKIEASINPQAFRNYFNLPETVKALLPAESKNDMNILEQIKAFFFGAVPATDTQVQELLGQHGTLGNYRDTLRTEIETELKAEHEQAINALQSGLTETETKLQAASNIAAEQVTKITDLEAKIAAMTTEIETLKASPASDHTGGAKAEESQPDAKPRVSDITARVAANLANNKKKLPSW